MIKDKLVTILGPTASGKTAMGIKAAKEFNGEIICADSRTVYRGMDIGTAKPSKEEQGDIKHHLLNIADPNKLISAADFKKRADKIINDIQSRGKLPILVGGSGMYIDSILYNYSFRNNISKLEKDNLDKLDLYELQQIAKNKYPKQFSKIDPKNRRRVEQLITKGPSKDDDRLHNKVDSLVIGLSIEMPTLRQNIAIRTKKMLNNGFIQEVQDLKHKYGECEVLKTTTGYAEVLNYLDHEISYEELSPRINASTWKLVKKQTTWFRRNKEIIWVNDYGQAKKLITGYMET